MAFTGNWATNTFKTGLLDGVFNFDTGTTQVFKIALYTNSATLNADTTAYTSTGEVASGYTINTTAVSTGILQAAVSTQPGLALFGTTTVGGRSLGDITGDSSVTSADSLAYTAWAAGANSNASQIAWIEGTLNPYMVANPTTYAAYLTTGSGTQYIAGGQVLVISQAPTIGNQTGAATTYLSFTNVIWNGAITARGALIYVSNGTTNPSVCVLDFGADKASTTTFTVQFPAVTNTSAIIRLS